jgi:hypothetical protein
MTSAKGTLGNAFRVRRDNQGEDSVNQDENAPGVG